MQTENVKVKVYGDDADSVLAVLDDIRNLYAPNVTQSTLQRSRPHGYHAFLTIYPRREP